MGEFTKELIATIRGSSVYGVTPAPMEGRTLALIDDNARSLCAAMLDWMAETKGIQSTSKAGETLTITYSDGTTQDFSVPNGTAGVGVGWNLTTISSGSSFTLTNGSWFYASSACSSLTLSDGLSFGESAILEFTTDSSCSFSAPASAVHSGDDCEDGVFVPESGKTYVVNYTKTGGGLWGIVVTRG